jgi:hypothetical protein
MPRSIAYQAERHAGRTTLKVFINLEHKNATGYSETRVTVSRKRNPQVDATNRGRRLSTTAGQGTPTLVLL